MDKSSRLDISLDEQRRAWNVWNAAARESRISTTSQRQAQEVESRVARIGRRDLSIIDVGCGAGWLCERLSRYGSVTGIDLADEIVRRASIRLPHVRFVTGDISEVELPLQSFDVVVTLEVLAHVADQPGFVARLAALLKPGGLLLLASQNRPVMERWTEVGTPYPGQIRRWVDARELRELLAAHFDVLEMTSLVPVGDEGWLRILNSQKLNRLLQWVVPRQRIECAKERALLGHTLLACARKRATVQPRGSSAIAAHLPHAQTSDTERAAKMLSPSASSAAASQLPLVSVAVPVYNGAQFLPRALDSLLAQTLTDFELLISDNASTDATQEICQSYCRRDPRVRYIRQPTNIGAPRNWNAVARGARGKYLKWATANDEYAPTMLEKCVAALEADPAAVLAQGTTCLVEQSTGTQEVYAYDLALLEPDGASRLTSLCMKLRLNNGQSGVIRQSALRKTRLDRPYEGGDFVLMAELALQGKFIVLPEVLFYRRMGPETFSRALSREQARQFYDPQAGRKLIADHWRLHFDFLYSIAIAPAPLRDRLAGLNLGLRRIAWESPTLFAAWRNKRAWGRRQ